jgi:single-stranded DNA-binding protein
VLAEAPRGIGSKTVTIPTQMSLQGFIATDPKLTFSESGVARFYACIGVQHFRKEADGAYTELEPTFHDLVIFRRSAERAYAAFRKGDSFVASGYVNEYEAERHGRSVVAEEFVARRIGHDAIRTRYSVERPQPAPPGAQPAPPDLEPSRASVHAPAVGM